MNLFNPMSDASVVAEIGMTHDGSFGLAYQLSEAAIKTGADIVKFQWHIAEEETTANAPSPPYFQNETRYEYFKRTEFSCEQFFKLHSLCKDSGVLSSVSVFSTESLKRAIKVGFDIIKIPSGEVTNIPLLRDVARARLPVMLSSGMSSWDELDIAVKQLQFLDSLCILQCSSIYPTPPDKVGLNVLQEMGERYGFPVGLSDHTLTSATAVAAVSMGAIVIEKHFTLSKELYGPDAKFSLNPKEFEQLVADIKFVSKAIKSKVDKNKLADYAEMKIVFQKSIVAAKSIKAGELLTMENLAFKKPGTGIGAARIDDVIGKITKVNLAVDDLLNFEMLADTDEDFLL